MSAIVVAPSPETIRINRTSLVGGVAFLVVLIVLTAFAVLWHLHQQSTARAAVEMRNLALSLDESLEGFLDATDIALLASADEIVRQMEAGTVDIASINHFLSRQQSRLPLVDHIWGLDSRGILRFGVGIPMPPSHDADRTYFQRLKEDPSFGPVLASVVLGRTNGKWFVPLARPMLLSDGSFAGVVFAALYVDQLEEILAQVEMRPGLVIALRDGDMGLIARRQSSRPDTLMVGDRRISATFRAALANNGREGTYVGGADAIDGIPRIHAYRVNQRYGFSVNVGLDLGIVRAEWGRQATVVAGFALLAIGSILLFGWQILRLWRRQEENMAVLHASRASLQEAQQIASLGHFTYDIATDRWSGSDTLEEILGIGPDFPRDGRHWLELLVPEWRQAVLSHFSLPRRGRPPLDREYRVIRPLDGEERWVREIARVQYDAEDRMVAVVGTIQDITDRKKSEERINELAFFDQLTGVANRTLLVDRLRQAVSDSQRSGRYGALLFIDLDNFKTLNDTLGHDMGDLLLKQVASRLNGCIRAGDTVARLGGDEFVVMVQGLGQEEPEAANRCEAVGAKVMTSLNVPYQLADVSYRCSPSIGVTLFHGDKDGVDELLKQADLAMYKAKSAGRNAIRFFDRAMEQAVLARAALESDLRDAVLARQFILHFQPQVIGDHVVGAEALVRWNHPSRGIVAPAEFIPLAEETGLILPLGQWVLETACEQLVRWAQRTETADLTLAVNVSARQFHQADFVAQIGSLLDRTGVRPQRLKLELTESLLVENVQDIIEKMFALKARGIGFALDDFGTGYSSMAYLKRLPLDQLKIDQSFVRDLQSDPNDATIAQTIVALGQTLGLAVIAEGVETTEQRDFLITAGCQAFQGYLFGRPLSLEAFEERLAAGAEDLTGRAV
jgi:diguanylate cyclase (GGDEF)-like protein/PAS domain S-box-containing protein